MPTVEYPSTLITYLQDDVTPHQLYLSNLSIMMAVLALFEIIPTLVIVALFRIRVSCRRVSRMTHSGIRGLWFRGKVYVDPRTDINWGDLFMILGQIACISELQWVYRGRTGWWLLHLLWVHNLQSHCQVHNKTTWHPTLAMFSYNPFTFIWSILPSDQRHQVRGEGCGRTWGSPLTPSDPSTTS